MSVSSMGTNGLCAESHNSYITVSTVTNNNKHVHRDLGSIKELHNRGAGSPVRLLPFISVHVIAKCILKAEILNMKIGFCQCGIVIYHFVLLLFFFLFFLDTIYYYFPYDNGT